MGMTAMKVDDLEKLDRLRILVGAARSHANRHGKKPVSVKQLSFLREPLTEEEEKEIEVYMRWSKT